MFRFPTKTLEFTAWGSCEFVWFDSFDIFMFNLLVATKVSSRDGASILNLSAKFIDRFIIESFNLFVMKLMVNRIRLEMKLSKGGRVEFQ